MSNPSSRFLKIAVLIRNFVTTGGAERYAVEVTKRLAKQHQVSVLCQTHDPTLCDGIEVMTIPRLCIKPRWLNQILFAMACRRALKNGNFDAVHSHERTDQFDALVVHCPCYKTKFVQQGAKGIFIYKLRQFFSLRHATYAWLEHQQFKWHPTRKLVVVSDYIARNIKLCYPDGNRNVVVAPPGVLMPSGTCSPPQDGERFEVLFVGTEFKRKGLEHAIRGFAAANFEKARLRVAGGGDAAPYRALATDLGVGTQVEFLGLVKNVEELYVSSHVFLFPTLIEPFGMSPLEAMSYGLPVIVSGPECNGFVEQLQEGEAMVLGNVNDADEIAKVLRSHTNIQNWQQCSQQSLRVAARLSWSHTTQQNLIAIEAGSKDLSPSP